MHALTQWGRYDSFHQIFLPFHHSRPILSSSNTLELFVVSFVDYNNEICPHPCHHPLIFMHNITILPISQFDHFSAFQLDSVNAQWYPMHMKHNRASKTLIRLIDGVFPIFALNNVNKLLRQRKAAALIPEPPMTTTPPQNHICVPRGSVSLWGEWSNQNLSSLCETRSTLLGAFFSTLGRFGPRQLIVVPS
jgi:hypothetical protein